MHASASGQQGRTTRLRCTSQGALYTYNAKCSYQNHSKACLHVTLLAFLTACFRVWEETHQSKQKRARPELSVRALLLHSIVAVNYAGPPPGPRPPPGPPGRRRRRRRLLSLAGGRPEPAV